MDPASYIPLPSTDVADHLGDKHIVVHGHDITYKRDRQLPDLAVRHRERHPGEPRAARRRRVAARRERHGDRSVVREAVDGLDERIGDTAGPPIRAGAVADLGMVLAVDVHRMRKVGTQAACLEQDADRVAAQREHRPSGGVRAAVGGGIVRHGVEHGAVALGGGGPVARVGGRAGRGGEESARRDGGDGHDP